MSFDGFDELLWDSPRRLRGSNVTEMDEEVRQQEEDPWNLLHLNVRLRSDGSPAEEMLESSNPIEDFAVANPDLLKPDERKLLGKFFRRHRERLQKEQR